MNSMSLSTSCFVVAAEVRSSCIIMCQHTHKGGDVGRPAK